MATAMLRAPEIIKRTGLCRVTLWRKIRDGTFPAPMELGPNAVGWPEDEVEAWLESRPRRTYGASEPYSPPEAA